MCAAIPSFESNSSIFNYGDKRIINEVGSVLAKLYQNSPKGSLTFFPNRQMLEAYVTEWKRSGIYEQMDLIKTIAVEFEDPLASKKSLRTFKESYMFRGANLFMVSNQSTVESLDLSDDMLRLVVIIGMPQSGLPQKYVRQREESMSKAFHEESTGGEEILRRRLLNYFASLVVRHRHDYGAVVLIGEEFAVKSNLDGLSSWIVRSIRPLKSIAEIINPMKEFFAKVVQKSFVNMDNTKAVTEIVNKENTHMNLMEANELTKKRNDQERKFVPLNKKRKEEMDIYNKALEEERIKKLMPPPPVPVEQKSEEKELEKPVVKVKPNERPAQETVAAKEQQIRSTQSEDFEETITYINDTEALRNQKNEISRSSIMKGRSTKAKLMCNICYETEFQMLVSKCGHICCQVCWEKRLKDLMECPMCKHKVRQKTLILISAD